MAEDDIYGSKKRYRRFKEKLDSLCELPRPGNRRAKYYCKNPENVEHFRRLLRHFEAQDLSYVRRLRVLQTMRVLCHFTAKNLERCERDDIDLVMAAAHRIYKATKSKETFVADLKRIFRILFPDLDRHDRPDETRAPYVVRHLKRGVDRSRQRARQDRLSWDELERIVTYFSSEPRIQAYITLAVESLARPQELLYLRIRDVELRENYARIHLSEHGKEGIGLLQCIDSYPYVLRWLRAHPLGQDPEAFLFINTGNTNRCEQLKPPNVNKLLRRACQDLGIDKPITCYSLKRNGVTLRRLRGESDMEIQHAARWTSTKQLKTYDMSGQEDAFRRELEKRGLVESRNDDAFRAAQCGFCESSVGATDTICPTCSRPLHPQKLRALAHTEQAELEQLRNELADLRETLRQVKRAALPELAKEVLAARST